MQKEKVLQNFGLTETEVAIYLSLLKTGEATASNIARVNNGNRTFTYDRLKKLSNLGLVSYVVKDNKKYFRPAKPSQLISILKEKEEQVKAILPELEKLKAPELVGPKVEVFSSKKGIKSALNLILKEKKEVLIHGSIFHFKKSIPNYYTVWNTRREKEKIYAKILTCENVEVPFAKTELLSEEEQSAVTTFTFSKYVVMILWSDVPVAILTESELIAKDQLTLFNNILKREIKIYPGITGIKRAWMELIEDNYSEVVGFGFSWNLAQIYGREFSEKWHKKREKNKISARLIPYADEKSIKYFNLRMIEHNNFNVQFLDKDFCGPGCVVLSNNLLVTFLYTEKKFRVIVSKNKEMISVYKKHFETLWKKSK